jgi:S-adenosylmethionine:tRNA ribosyltransferase-isomerase
MNLENFEYDLPKELIAQKPLEVRDSSRLMVLDGGMVHTSFNALPDYLKGGDVLVLNDSRVVKAKLMGRKKSGGRIELLMLKSKGDDGICLIRGKKIRVGTEIEIGNVTSEVTEKLETGFQVKFDEKISNILEKFGEAPLPYYIKTPLMDSERYQTVFSEKKGSIAAPTAGLHFTEQLIHQIKKKGVKIAKITLHIGPSTFLPLRKGEKGQHNPEYFTIEKKDAKILNQGWEDGSIFAVGTTSVKALESATVDGVITAGDGWSSLFITPGYEFRVPIKGMITNFHLPRSSLLMLVCALFGREKILKSYSEAVKKGYRFYSFGDAMLILR